MISPKSLRLPASAEFVARCGLVAQRRFGRSHSSQDVPAVQLHVEPASADDIIASLQRLGIQPGDDLLVHSDAAAMESIGWDPSDIIDLLLDYIADGTLMMPSHPRLKITNSKLTYNVRRSPSTVGLMTELFRRRAGVIRSRFPYSAAAAIGSRAAELIEDHANSFAPHDEHSPYSKLADFDGKVLCLGCDLDRMTMLHVAEDRRRSELQIPAFHQPKTVRVIDGEDESTVVAHTRAPWLWWYLSLSKWTSNMYRHNIARDVTVGGLTMRVASAKRMVCFMEYEIKTGSSLYPLAKYNRWLKLTEPQLEAA